MSTNFICWHPLILMDFVHILFNRLTNNKFVTFLIFYFSLILSYFPQHCLYFFPEPQGLLYLGLWQIFGALGSLIQHLVALGSTP